MKEEINIRRNYNGDKDKKYRLRTDIDADILSYKIEDFLEEVED